MEEMCINFILFIRHNFAKLLAIFSLILIPFDLKISESVFDIPARLITQSKLFNFLFTS